MNRVAVVEAEVLWEGTFLTTRTVVVEAVFWVTIQTVSWSRRVVVEFREVPEEEGALLGMSGMPTWLCSEERWAAMWLRILCHSFQHTALRGIIMFRISHIPLVIIIRFTTIHSSNSRGHYNLDRETRSGNNNSPYGLITHSGSRLKITKVIAFHSHRHSRGLRLWDLLIIGPGSLHEWHLFLIVVWLYRQMVYFYTFPGSIVIVWLAAVWNIESHW